MIAKARRAFRMAFSLVGFPKPVLVVDGALTVLDYSRRSLALFGLREAEGDRGGEQLTRAIVDASELGDNLALATARLLKPGEEECFDWKRRGRAYEVAVCVAEGEGSAFTVMFSDTTDQHMTEEIQVNARHYLEDILEDIPIGVAVLNSELKITSVNRKMLEFVRLMGVSAGLEDVIGASPQELLPPETGSRWREMCDQVVRTGERSPEDKRSFPTGEGDLVLATEVTPLRHRSGEPMGAILMSTDVTERTRLERELVNMEKLATVGQMVVTVNHEINNPPSIISTNAQSIRLMNRDLNEKTTAKLLTIEQQVKRISQVTERLRTMDEVVSSEYITDGPAMIDLRRPGGESDK